ncbi:hypothetical protein AAFC00_000165 [Neodothiora populina]|uniref:RNA polymerase I-specific transcription initiation factor RRN3 n=1 Tax=Neodothiora populina TaxID=2781224 RepID=A0ABR3P1Z1_9PEZI
MVPVVSAPAAMAPPAFLPQKSLKRDASHLSSPPTTPRQGQDAVIMPSTTQSKRLKVAFDDKVDVRILDDWSSKPLDLVKEEVRSALDGHHRSGADKDDTAYEQLRMVFVSAGTSTGPDGQVREADESSLDKPSTSLLKKYMIALVGRVGHLKACANLVVAILDVNWMGRDDSLVALYVRFLGALGVAVPGYMRSILDRIVRHFVHLPASLGRIPGESQVSRQQMTPRLHNALRYLLRLIPSASSALVESLRAAFPNHHTATRQSYVGYVKSALRVVDYAPELKAEILTLVTERLVKVDVEVQEEIDELDDDIDEKIVLAGKQAGLSADVRAGDSDADDSDNESVTSSELSITPEEMQIRALRDTVSKLDAVLDLLFAHYTTTFAEGKIFQVNEAFEHLLSQFATFVLPTFRSRHTQFLIFHFSQASQSYAERFAAVLVQMALGRGVASHAAVSAAAYLASFIARGARISKHLIRDIFVLLANHLDQMRRVADPTCRGPDLRRYTLFYATAQAMLYIFCFRWRDFIVYDGDEDHLEDYDIFEDGDPEWMPGIKETLTQAIYSKLNPLKVCSPMIVNQFATIANHLRFMYVIPLLETNKRLRLSSVRSLSSLSSTNGGISDMGAGRRETTLSNKHGESHHQLDAFFPFDPYQLPKSKRWLDGDYMEWRNVPGMQEDDDDEDDDESDISDSDDEGDDDDDDDDDDEEENDVRGLEVDDSASVSS